MLAEQEEGRQRRALVKRRRVDGVHARHAAADIVHAVARLGRCRQRVEKHCGLAAGAFDEHGHAGPQQLRHAPWLDDLGHGFLRCGKVRDSRAYGCDCPPCRARPPDGLRRSSRPRGGGHQDVPPRFVRRRGGGQRRAVGRCADRRAGALRRERRRPCLGAREPAARAGRSDDQRLSDPQQRVRLRARGRSRASDGGPACGGFGACRTRRRCLGPLVPHGHRPRRRCRRRARARLQGANAFLPAGDGRRVCRDRRSRQADGLRSRRPWSTPSRSPTPSCAAPCRLMSRARLCWPCRSASMPETRWSRATSQRRASRARTTCWRARSATSGCSRATATSAPCCKPWVRSGGSARCPTSPGRAGAPPMA